MSKESSNHNDYVNDHSLSSDSVRYALTENGFDLEWRTVKILSEAGLNVYPNVLGTPEETSSPNIDLGSEVDVVGFLENDSYQRCVFIVEVKGAPPNSVLSLIQSLDSEQRQIQPQLIIQNSQFTLSKVGGVLPLPQKGEFLCRGGDFFHFKKTDKNKSKLSLAPKDSNLFKSCLQIISGIVSTIPMWEKFSGKNIVTPVLVTNARIFVTNYESNQTVEVKWAIVKNFFAIRYNSVYGGGIWHDDKNQAIFNRTVPFVYAVNVEALPDFIKHRKTNWKQP